MSNQGNVQASVRERSGSTANLSWNEDWHYLWDQEGVAAGTFNERMLTWINTELGETYTSLPGAMQAYAESLGFYNWSSMNEIGAGLEEFISYNHLPPNDNSFNAAHVFIFDVSGLDIPDFTVEGVKIELAGAVNSIYIGPQAASGDAYDASSLTQIFFSGSPSIAQAFDAVTVSDLASFTWDKTANLIVSCFKDSGRMPTDASSVVSWWTNASGSEVGTANKTLPYSDGGGVIGGVSKIILYGN
jgi:hypothetical protein